MEKFIFHRSGSQETSRSDFLFLLFFFLLLVFWLLSLLWEILQQLNFGKLEMLGERQNNGRVGHFGRTVAGFQLASKNG